jgi:hypothetical protein
MSSPPIVRYVCARIANGFALDNSFLSYVWPSGPRQRQTSNKPPHWRWYLREFNCCLGHQAGPLPFLFLCSTVQLGASGKHLPLSPSNQLLIFPIFFQFSFFSGIKDSHKLFICFGRFPTLPGLATEVRFVFFSSIHHHLPDSFWSMHPRTQSLPVSPGWHLPNTAY